MAKIPTWTFYVLALVIGLLALWTLRGRRFVVEVSESDRSMRPAIGDRTRFTANPAWNKNPARGAIVAFIPPGRGARAAVARVARVAALPGDIVEVRRGFLQVKGSPSKISRKIKLPSGKIRVPRGHAYLLTDSPGGVDSVSLGPIPLWRVLGAVPVQEE